MEKLLPILSDGLRDCINSILENYNSDIAATLIKADRLTNSYNELTKRYLGLDDDAEIEIFDLIKNEIDSLINDDIRALSIRKDVFEISYTPKGKELLYTSANTWDRQNRQTGKPGRTIKKLLKFEYKERDIEIFNNLLKAEILNIGEFKIVSKEDITKYYNVDTYYKEAGTLGNSCMRYPSCEDYFKIYEDNAKMLICVKNDQLLGRAIIWEIDNKIYLDRIYTCMDYLEEQFIQYAEDHKWYHRVDNSLLNDGDDQYWFGPEDNYNKEINPRLIIKLKNQYYEFPYVDSFRYYNPNKNTISTNSFDGACCLSNTDGSYDYNEESYCCENCGYEECVPHGECPEDLNWSDYDECYYCDDCCWYSDGLSTYVGNDHERCVVKNKYGFEDFPKTYVLNKEMSKEEFINGEQYGFIKINDTYYDVAICIYNKEKDTIEVKDEYNKQ